MNSHKVRDTTGSTPEKGQQGKNPFSRINPVTETFSREFIQRCLHDDLDLSQAPSKATDSALFIDDETYKYALF